MDINDILEQIITTKYGPAMRQHIYDAIKLTYKDATSGTVDSVARKLIDDLKAAVGTPLKAATAADMTDTAKIYVYVGSETGMVNGDWYFWDENANDNIGAWIDGGVYNSTAFDSDKTLSIDGAAADAKKTGEAVDALNRASTYPVKTSLKAQSLMINDAASAAVKGAVVTIKHTQTGSGTPSISNVRPIIGTNSVNVWRIGKNLLEPAVGYSTGITFSKNADGTLHIQGTATANSWIYVTQTCDLAEVGLSVGDTVTLVTDLYAAMAFLDSVNTVLGTYATTASISKTIPSNTAKILVYMYAFDSSSVSGVSVNRNAKFALIKGSDSTWEAFKGKEKITTNFAETVADATYNMINGALTETKKMVVFGQVDTIVDGRYVIKRYDDINVVSVNTDDCITSKLTYNAAFEQRWGYYHNSNAIVITVPAGTTVNDFNSQMADVQILYNVGKPTTKEIDHHVLHTNTGYMRVWTDAQDVSLTYRALSPYADTATTVSPEQFGAVGDGVTDDTAAWQAAVDSGRNVVALGEKYKCGRITVTKNISIDCNGAEFFCSDYWCFEITGKTTATLTNQYDYRMNDEAYTLRDSDYSSYTGMAMLKGTNNFNKTRTNYKGGFICSFHDGRIEGSYPVDVYDVDGVDAVTIELIEPVTVRLSNVGDIHHTGTRGGSSIYLCRGRNCVIENINGSTFENDNFINVIECLNCGIQNVNMSVEDYAARQGVGYAIVVSDSAYTSITNAHIYNKYWHCVSTGGDYLCYRTVIQNCVLLNDKGRAFEDHDNAIGTLIQNCVAANLVIAAQGTVRSTYIVSRLNTAGGDSPCDLIVLAPSDARHAGATLDAITFFPADNCTNGARIALNTYPQVSGQTYYYNNIFVRDARVVEGSSVGGKFYFDFAAASPANSYFVLGKFIFDNCQLGIDLSYTNQSVSKNNYSAKKAVYEDV